VYFAVGRFGDFARTADRLGKLPMTPFHRIAMATLRWAAARLTGSPDVSLRTRVLQVYAQIPNRTSIPWSWNGTKHAVKYGRFRYEVVKPILDVLELLEQPVTDENRKSLSDLLQAPTQLPRHP
jgi:hypothetical protein